MAAQTPESGFRLHVKTNGLGIGYRLVGVAPNSRVLRPLLAACPPVKRRELEAA